jgi:hypothetical protein
MTELVPPAVQLVLRAVGALGDTQLCYGHIAVRSVRSPCMISAPSRRRAFCTLILPAHHGVYLMSFG